MTGLPGGRKSFKIGLAVLVEYRRVTDTHPASQARCRSIIRRAGKKRSINKFGTYAGTYSNEIWIVAYGV